MEITTLFSCETAAFILCPEPVKLSVRFKGRQKSWRHQQVFFLGGVGFKSPSGALEMGLVGSGVGAGAMPFALRISSTYSCQALP